MPRRPCQTCDRIPALFSAYHPYEVFVDNCLSRCLHLRHFWTHLRHHTWSSNVRKAFLWFLRRKILLKDSCWCWSETFTWLLTVHPSHWYVFRYFTDQRTGQITLFYPQSGSQFVAEGFVIGFLNLMCGGALIFIAYAAPKFKSESNRSAAVIGSMIVFIICFSQIRGFYKMKNRWYGSVWGATKKIISMSFRWWCVTGLEKILLQYVKFSSSALLEVILFAFYQLWIKLSLLTSSKKYIQIVSRFVEFPL